MKEVKVKIGDKVEVRDGFTDRVGTVYGFKTNRWGTEIRVKIEEAGVVTFTYISRVYEYPPISNRTIASYKVA